MRRIVVLMAMSAVLAGCDEPGKTYQQACFQRLDTPQQNMIQALITPDRVATYDPVLTVQPTPDATYVHCSN